MYELDNKTISDLTNKVIREQTIKACSPLDLGIEIIS